MKKRLDLAGEGDPVMATSAMDLLLTRGHISEEQHEAGRRYARWRHALYGVPVESAAGGRVHGSPMSDEDAVEVTERLAKLDVALKRAGRRAYDAVVNAAVYDRTPSWSDVAVGRRQDLVGGPEWRTRLARLAADRDALLAGLDAAAEHLGLKSGRRAA